jgi:hypothetical protein
LLSTSSILSCGFCKKYKDEKACIEDVKVEFQHTWLLDLTTSGQPIIFPPHLHEIDVMTKWLQEAIQSHQVARITPINEDILLLSVPPSFIMLIYKKMKAYGNHFSS